MTASASSQVKASRPAVIVITTARFGNALYREE